MKLICFSKVKNVTFKSFSFLKNISFSVFLILVIVGWTGNANAQTCLGCNDPTEQIIDLCDPECSGGGNTTNTCSNSALGNVNKCQKITFDLTEIANDCGTDISDCTDPGVLITVYQGCGESSTSNLL